MKHIKSAIELSNYMTVEILNVKQPKLIPKMKEGVKWMISTEKIFNTIVARSVEDLKPGVVKKKKEGVKKRGVGSKREEERSRQ